MAGYYILGVVWQIKLDYKKRLVILETEPQN